MSDGCAACGARQVGPPLVRPERELPSYGYAIAAVAGGVVLVALFIGAFISTLLQFDGFAFEPQFFQRVAEKTAWRLKWTALPLSFLAAWACARYSRQVRHNPARFAGLRLVRGGFAVSALIAATLTTLIGITVPARLERRELARRAAENAQLHASAQVLSEYRKRFDTYPHNTADLRKLDDPDCTFAATIALMEAGEYKPETDLASLSPQIEKDRKQRRPSVARIRNASARSTDDLPNANLSFTNYDLVLPGRDAILGTDDDLRIRDGLILAPSKESDAAQPLASVKKN